MGGALTPSDSTRTPPPGNVKAATVTLRRKSGTRMALKCRRAVPGFVAMRKPNEESFARRIVTFAGLRIDVRTEAGSNASLPASRSCEMRTAPFFETRCISALDGESGRRSSFALILPNRSPHRRACRSNRERCTSAASRSSLRPAWRSRRCSSFRVQRASAAR